MKRQGNRCRKCYNYEPHGHLERLLKAPPKTVGDEFIFFPSSGDIAYASFEQIQRALAYARKYGDRTFLMQTKDPELLLPYEFPDNVIIGTTIETDLLWFPDNPSGYLNYNEVSKAPASVHRMNAMLQLKHKRKMVTIEPILLFGNETLPSWVKTINPEIVYVGYDNHNCHLPEPQLSDTETLITQLKEIHEVRVKSLRKAWYER